MKTDLPEGLQIHVEGGVCLVTDPMTSSSFVFDNVLNKENLVRAIAAHRDRWRRDELQYAPALQALRDGGFLPSRSVVTSLILSLLLLCCASDAKPTVARTPLYPDNMRFAPYIETLYDARGNWTEVHTFTLLPGGREWRHTVRYRSGKVDSRVFPVPAFRIGGSRK